MPTYYIDTNSLATATSIWSDANLTTKAANGFYQKNGIYRQMSNGELLASKNCPECYFSFGSSLVQTTSTAACSSAITETYYFGNVDGEAGQAEPEVGDLVFNDSEGTTPLGAGFYKLVSGSYIQVNSSGVVILVASCGLPPSPINVTSVGGFMEACTGGSIDDYMGAVVVLDNPIDFDTNFSVVVSYVEPGGTCGGFQLTETFSVDIFQGESISNFNTCSQGTNFPAGAVICGACIGSCDNPNVTIAPQFECPL